MATAKASPPSLDDLDKLRDDWLVRLTGLIDQVEAWGIELGWSTRRIEIFYQSESDRWLLLDKQPFDQLGPATKAMKSKPLSFEMSRTLLAKFIQDDS